MRIQVNLLVSLALLTCISLSYALFKGSTFSSSHPLWDLLNGREDAQLHEILFAIRLPRVLAAFVTGGLLALSGSLMQILLRNPLADPYILGVSGGAAVFTLIFLLIGVTGAGLTLGAWGGAIMATLLVFIVSRNGGLWNSQRVLLTGIAFASGFSALISFILFLSPDHQLRGMLFWLMGDLSYAHLPVFEALILIVGLIASLAVARELNILLRGEQQARVLGVGTQRLQIFLYLLTSVLTATAVTLAGCIGFVGLIVPHMLRLLGLPDQRFLLPSAVLLGGSLLTIADLLARTLWEPQELPVGIMMSLIGIPVFLWLLKSEKT